jgi:hypothetical protein
MTTKITWTDAAREAWDGFFAAHETALVGAGADAREVREDLRRHVEDDAAAAGETILTREFVERFLARQAIGDGSAAVQPARPTVEVRSPHPKRTGPWREGLFLIFAVLLPSLAIIVELFMGVTADVAFDPMPTLGHIILLILVPVANYLVLKASRTTDGIPFGKGLLGWLNGAALAVATFYSILYLPLIPISFVGTLVMGIGFLGLTPFFAWGGALRGRIFLRRLNLAVPHSKPARFWPGFASGIALICLFAVPQTLTRLGLIWSTALDADRQKSGLSLLRAWGDEEDVLRACYVRPSGAGDLLGFLISRGDPITTDEARRVYYRAFGQPFNDRPQPDLHRQTIFPFVGGRSFDFDDDQGGDAVGGRVSKLTLDASRLDGSADADAGHAYLEWTMVFKNEADRQHEARAQVALPPGAVVSRLTLWVDGEEREAAFAGRSQVRQAYERVVARQRDPVLVTSAGPDRILVQCFPVPAHGTMKIRFGMTIPLMATGANDARLVMPGIVERNFEIASRTKHAVWVEARRPMRSLGSVEDEDASDTVVRAKIEDARLTPEQTAISLMRDSGAAVTWSIDPAHPDSDPVIARWTRAPSAPVPYVVFVLDGSAPSADEAKRAQGALEKLPRDFRHEIMLASDEPGAFVGGQDNLPTLESAWDAASRVPGGVVVWLHGAQPVDLGSAEGLGQRWDRRPDGPRVIAFALKPGPHRVLEDLDGIARIGAAPRLGTLDEDLTRLLETLRGVSSAPVLVREKVSSAATSGARKTSTHLARLFAYERVHQLLLGTSQNRQAATELAALYQLVTPVSGAVVLENQEQYTEAGLEPVNPATVPSIPEPSVVALLAVVLAFVAARLWRIRRAVGHGIP